LKEIDMKHLLDNISWRALTGPQAMHACGSHGARRFAPGFSPILGFADLTRPDFTALVPFCPPGELFYCIGWSGAAPDGWRIENETTMFRMVWDGLPPVADPFPEAVRIDPMRSPAAAALAALTRPGPFGPRTVELGDYFGCLDGDRLVAMAGERFLVSNLREISGVCTHPSYQRQGLAQRLVLKLVWRQLQRGETPFLHVMQGNQSARRLYRNLGFVEHGESVVRVVSRAGSAEQAVGRP
jgi:GNAT superfamily N-acetyltransferase